MGNWKFEVGKIAMFVSCPVALFVIFTQPNNFKEWVANRNKREIYPPENQHDRQAIEQLIKDTSNKKKIQA